jgi:hypothetical protein
VADDHGRSDYRRALDAALREYEALTGERAKLDARIAQLAQTIGNLTRLCGMTPTVPWGLSDACRIVLKAAGHPLTVGEVRGHLEAIGVDLTRYANELAAIHTTLKRLRESGHARLVPRAGSKPAYVWADAPVAIVLTEAERQHLRDHATNLVPPLISPPTGKTAGKSAGDTAGKPASKTATSRRKR